MRGVNKVILVGNLGKDPEVRYLPSGGAVANVTVATSEAWRDKNTGQMQEQTEWHRIVFYGKLAEIAGEYLRKGSKVYVEGSLHTRKWQDKATGQDRYSTEIKASSMQMLDSRNAGQPGAAQGGGSFDQSGGEYGNYVGGFEEYDQGGGQPSAPQPAAAAPQRPAQRPQQALAQRQAPSAPVDNFDDDIPF